VDPKNAGEIVLTTAAVKVTVNEGNALDYWTDALKDKDGDVRRIALDTLADMGKAARSSSNAVLASLADSASEARLKAHEALEKIEGMGDRALLPAFTKTLKDEEIPVRATSARVLAALLPKEKETPDLLLPLLQDRYALVRRASLEALNTIGFER